MIAAWGSGRSIPFAAALLALLLCGVLAWEWGQGLQMEGRFAKLRNLPATAVPALSIQPEFGLPDAEKGFPELLVRPIFLISRRPMASAGAGGSAVTKAAQFVLVGVVITPNQHSALLRDIESGKTETIAMGAKVGNMTLEAVEPDMVVLRQGAVREELPLKVMVAVKQPSPQPPQAQAAPVPTPPAVAARPAAAPLPLPKPTPTKPRELTPAERAEADKQYKTYVEERVSKGLPVPATPPPWATAK